MCNRATEVSFVGDVRAKQESSMFNIIIVIFCISCHEVFRSDDCRDWSCFITPREPTEAFRLNSSIWLVSFLVSLLIFASPRLPRLMLRDKAKLNALVWNCRVQGCLTGCSEIHRKLLKQWDTRFKNQHFHFRLCAYYLKLAQGNTILVVSRRKYKLFVFSWNTFISLDLHFKVYLELLFQGNDECERMALSNRN